MLENIKQNDFYKSCFCKLNEKRKLQLVKYNKNIQSKININIINYKIMSGRYIINEDKEKVKIYDIYNNRIIFDGEYFRGKEYNNNGNMIFMGEYLNGKRNGKGKEYNYNGELEFEGEYLNGEKWNGKGKEYYYDGKLMFEGEYLNGERNGKGKNYYFDGKLMFEGEYIFF